jgi:hypothetical protein
VLKRAMAGDGADARGETGIGRLDRVAADATHRRQGAGSDA